MKFSPQKHFPVRLLAGLISLYVASAMAGTPVTYKDGLHHQVSSDTDSAYILEKNSVLDVVTGGSAGSTDTQSQVSHAGVNVNGGTLVGSWELARGGELSMTGNGTNTRLNGALTLFSGSHAGLDGVAVTRKKALAFHVLGGALDMKNSTVQASNTALDTDSSHRGAVVNISRSRITAGKHGIYLGGEGSSLTLSQTDITGGESALFFRSGGNTVLIHGGSLISTGKTHIEGYGHPVKSGAIIFLLSDKSRYGGQAFSVDSGTRIEDLASDGAGIYIMNGASTPVTGTLTDTLVTGGRYGVYVANPENTPGTTTLTLDHTRVTGRDDAAIRVEGGTHLNATLKNGAQLTGGNNTLASIGKGSQLNLSVENSSLTGNLLNNEGGTENVTLNKGGMLTGMMQNVTTLKMTDGAVWALTGNSSVGNLSNGGLISLAQGAAHTGNVLTVGGNYAGNGGKLEFNTRLGDDHSPTDKLLVNGNASGTTGVSVNNVGGTGAKTVDGIEIIHVNGSADASAFTRDKNSRIVAGLYDYDLKYKRNVNGGSGWYLDSAYTGPGPDPKPDPDNHKVRPEPGSYIANMAATSMFLTTLHERAGENRYVNTLSDDGNVTSLWLRQVGTHNQFRDTSGQLHTTGSTYVAQLGGDLAQWSSTDHDRWHMGGMAGYGNNHNNTQSRVTGSQSKGSVNGYSAGVYGTWYQNDADRTGAYVDSQVMYNWFTNHVSGDKISAESYDSKGLLASVESGYTLALGQFGHRDNPMSAFIEPQVQVTWNGVKADDITESNGTRVSIQGRDNIQTRVGGRAFLQGHNRLDDGKARSFQPFVEVNWLHNTKHYGVTMNGLSDQQAGATNLGEVKLGVEGQLTKRLQLQGEVGQQVGTEGYSNTAAMVNVKYSF